MKKIKGRKGNFMPQVFRINITAKEMVAKLHQTYHCQQQQRLMYTENGQKKDNQIKMKKSLFVSKIGLKDHRDYL